MRTWTATTTVDASPEAVLDALCDPEACARWAPVRFEVRDLRARRLHAGARARVAGRLAGREVGFDVDVHEAGRRRLALTATGPVGFDVAYDVAPAAAGTEVRAAVSVRPAGGLLGRVAAHATTALLAAGALDDAVARLGREAVTTTRSRKDHA
ncbi:MAG TPA: SRPBCC family protein [Capillimicrobium sp.]|nr:SRPBCC family protein [Capillimicrobium sp.]